MTKYDDRYKALGVKPSDVFEVYPHNTEFLHGNMAKPKFLKQLNGFWLLLTLACIITIDTIAFLSFFTVPSMVAQFGSLAYANLIQPCSNIHKSGCFVEYRYTIDDNTVEGSQSVTANTFLQTYPDQKRIEVKYLSFLPNQAVIVYPQFGDKPDQSTVETVAFNIFTIPFVAASFFLIVAIIDGVLITIFRRQRWPKATLVIGSVSECTGTWQKTKSGRNFNVKVTFAYQLPDADQVVTKTISETRNDLVEEVIPFLGKKVIVVAYRSPRPNRKGKRRPSSLNFVL